MSGSRWPGLEHGVRSRLKQHPTEILGLLREPDISSLCLPTYTALRDLNELLWPDGSMASAIASQAGAALTTGAAPVSPLL